VIDLKEEGAHLTTSPTTPPVTDALRAEARANPGAWIYTVDPGFDGQPDVPPQGVVGAWHSDEKGELSDDFTPNPRYLPTPQARGWDEPLTVLERVLQLVLSGYLPEAQLAREFVSAEVFIFSRPDGGIFLAPAQDGSQLVYAYTDADKATASGFAEHRVIAGSELAAALPDGVRIALNPGSAVSAIIEPADVTSA
jgi:hypothetical protein